MASEDYCLGTHYSEAKVKSSIARSATTGFRSLVASFHKVLKHLPRAAHDRIVPMISMGLNILVNWGINAPASLSSYHFVCSISQKAV